jgi:hypothetical protein
MIFIISGGSMPMDWKLSEKHDNNVENALYKLALSGNIQAIIFYLTNRRPESWVKASTATVPTVGAKATAETTAGNDISGNSIDLESLTDSELELLASVLEKIEYSSENQAGTAESL